MRLNHSAVAEQAQEGIQTSPQGLLLLALTQQQQREYTPSNGVTNTPGPLTPSDLIFLDKGPLAKEGWEEWITVPRPYYAQVLERVLVAAVLANEKAGALRLEIVKEKVFFGWFTNTNLYYATPLRNSARWPAGSLEYVLGYASESISKVSDIFYRWLGEDYSSPLEEGARRTLDSMVNRGLLDREVVQERVLKLFNCSRTYYTLPDRTAALVAEQTAESAWRLLAECQQNRPEVFSLLLKEIRNGFSRRQLSSG